MRDGDTLAAFTYGPSEINVKINDVAVRIEEITKYPFENKVRFLIHTEKPVSFELVLREPEWAVSTHISLNGETLENCFEAGICRLLKVYKEGDLIELSFKDEIRLIENAGGISVKKGPLLYALPIEEEVVIEGLRELGNEDFPHYSLYPRSKWNYGLCVDSVEEMTSVEGEVGEEPWRASQNGLRLCVKVREIPNWKLEKRKKVQIRRAARGKSEWVEREGIFTPKVRKIKEDAKLGEVRTVSLVPYATTRLRIGIFPIVNNK